MRMKKFDLFSNSAYKFGFGFFETMRVIKKKIIFFDEHIERLNSSLKNFKLEVVDKEMIKRKILNEISKKKIEDARVRITYSMQQDGPFISYEVQEFESVFPDKSNLMIYDDVLFHGDLVRQHKTTNYFLYYYQYVRARNFGFDEIIFIDDMGHILEGSRTNVFLVFYRKNFEDLKIYTPKINCGVLPGIARNKVIEICKSLGYQIKEAQIPYNAFLKAQEIFLTNSLYGVIPTSGFKSKAKDKITNQIKKECEKYFQV